MWELPHVEVPEADTAYGEAWHRDRLRAGFEQGSLTVQPSEWFMQIEHIFSHIHWNMEVYLCHVDQAEMLPKGWLWMDTEQRAQVAFPNVFLRILKRYEQVT
jgi:A/G-specific adenine glycosylase